MPKVIPDYTDTRNKAWCIHCGASTGKFDQTDDHTPSKVLLDRPFPDNLATTRICKDCNQSFSLDEEYFVAFLSAVLSGTTDPDKQIVPRASKILRHAKALRRKIDQSKEVQLAPFDRPEIRWTPDVARIQNVILKNARAHLFHENGEPMFDNPEFLLFQPLPVMSEVQLAEFFGAEPEVSSWCEVGSRWNTRIIEGDQFDDDGFLVVQRGVYRFRIEAGGQGIKSVIREYLATSVFW